MPVLSSSQLVVSPSCPALAVAPFVYQGPMPTYQHHSHPASQLESEPSAPFSRSALRYTGLQSRFLVSVM